MLPCKVTQAEATVPTKDVLKACYLLQLRRGYYKASDLAEQLGLEPSQLKALTDELLRLGFIKPVQGGQGPAGDEPESALYRLTEEGRAQVKVVLTGGVFDIIHLGHIGLLKKAKALGDVLVVVVASDVTVESFKGRRPIFTEEERRALVEALKPVDKAIVGYDDVGVGFEQVLLEVNPDIVAFGYDQSNLLKVIAEIVERKGLKVKLVTLPKYEGGAHANISSSLVRGKLAGGLEKKL